MTAEVTLYRCYWPAAFSYLKALGTVDTRAFTAKAYDLLMTLEVAEEHAYAVASLLPTGAVIDVISVALEPLQNQDIDELLFFGTELNAGFDKN